MEKITMVFAFLFLIGIIGSEKESDKKACCCGFVACIAAVAFLEAVRMAI